MEANELSKKSHAIVEAIAAGHSCEQILAADRTLTYHDIFHAVTEIPTSHWRKPAAGVSSRRCPRQTGSIRTPAKQRSD
jgi:hypothetical protein